MADAVCVQCGGRFKSDENAACLFHVGEVDRRMGKGQCCGQREPCQKQVHRAKHHCEYPYYSFFERAWAIMNYTDTRTVFAEIELENPDDNTTEKASVSQLLRWKTRADYIGSQNILLVQVGRLWKTEKYWFETYTEKDLDAIGAKGEALIFRTSERSDQYAMAEWIINDGVVGGVRLTCKVACFDTPAVTEALFTQFPLTHTETKVISKPGVQEHPPATPYSFPTELVTNYPGGGASLPDLSTVVKRDKRNDFPTLDKVSKKREIELNLDKMDVNQDRVFDGKDNFGFVLQVMNTGQGTYMFTKFKVEYKILNTDTWYEVAQDDIEWGYYKPFPFTLGPMASGDIQGHVRVPHWFGDNDARVESKDARPNWYRSTIARHKPLRFRFTLLTAKSEEVSRVGEFVQKIPKLEQPGDEALFLHADNPHTCDRVVLRLKADQDGDNVVSGDMSLTIKEAQALVFEANKSGKSEILLSNKGYSSDHKTSTYYALVDVACQTVYAIKAQLLDKTSGIIVQGYCPLRYYGPADAEKVEPVPATEEATPEGTVEAVSMDELFQDEDQGKDDLSESDLNVGDSGSSSSTSGGGGGGGGPVNIDLKGLETSLKSVNENLTRIAFALETLVALKLQKAKDSK